MKHPDDDLDPHTLRVLAREWHTVSDEHSDLSEALRARLIANDLQARAARIVRRRKKGEAR